MPARSPALRVAAPCPLRWQDMAGDDRVRFCGKCQQHVYNVESLKVEAVRALIQQREGRVCVRLQQRADGTVITRDCWYVVRRARERLVATALGVAVAAVGFWGGVGLLSRRIWGWRPEGPTCPSPLSPRASLPELPEPEEPEWMKKRERTEQGGRSRPKRPRRIVQPKRSEDLSTMGLAVLRD
jgi:hypothetical protein